MFRNNLVRIALAFPIVILAVWILGLEYRSNAANRVKVTVEGYDPRSLISGHYLQLRVNWEDTDCRQFPQEDCPKELFEKIYRFYLPESDAAEMERLIFKKRPLMQLEFALWDNKPLIRELFIEKQLWSDWYRQQKTSEE